MQIYDNLFLFVGISLLVAVTTSLQVGNTGDANDEDGTEYNRSSRRHRGRSPRVEERDKIILQIRRENPDWTYKRVAAEAQYKINGEEEITAETVRNAERWHKRNGRRNHRS